MGPIRVIVNKPYYVAGDEVEGVVIVELRKSTEIKKIDLLLKGEEKVKLEVEDTDSDGDKRTRKYDQERTCFKHKERLSDRCELEEGHHEFPFSFELPPSLPSSFPKEKGRSGSTEYKIKTKYSAKVEVDVDGWFAKDLKAKKEITVYSTLHHRAEPRPISLREKKGFWFKSGDMIMSTELPTDMYFLGQAISFPVQVVNETSKEIQKLKVKLYRRLEVKADGHHFTLDEEVARREFDGVEPNSTAERELSFEFPYSTPTSDGRLIDCTNRLEIEADLSFNSDLELHAPITLLVPVAMEGTTELRSD